MEHALIINNNRSDIPQLRFNRLIVLWSGAPARIWTRVGKIQLKKKWARSAEIFFYIAHPVF